MDDAYFNPKHRVGKRRHPPRRQDPKKLKQLDAPVKVRGEIEEDTFLNLKEIQTARKAALNSFMRGDQMRVPRRVVTPNVLKPQSRGLAPRNAHADALARRMLHPKTSQIVEQWCNSYHSERGSFNSVALFAEAKLHEVFAVTMPVDEIWDPSKDEVGNYKDLQLAEDRLAICSDVLVKVSTLFGRFAPVLQTLLRELFRHTFQGYISEATTNQQVTDTGDGFPWQPQQQQSPQLPRDARFFITLVPYFRLYHRALVTIENLKETVTVCEFTPAPFPCLPLPILPPLPLGTPTSKDKERVLMCVSYSFIFLSQPASSFSPPSPPSLLRSLSP